MRIYPFLLLISLISCKKSATINIRNESSTSNGLNRIKEIIIPKTGYMNDTIKGELIFDMSIDTLPKSRIRDRRTYLFVSTEKIDSLSIESIKKKDHDIFGDKMGKGRFKFYFILKKPGNTNVSFVVEDNLLLKPLDTSTGMTYHTIDYRNRINIFAKKRN
jgi:hypothetical protein